MKNNQLLKEVRQFQKIAGILKEDDNIDDGMQAEEKRLNYRDKPNFGFEPGERIQGTWILDNEGESVYLITQCPSYASFLARVEDRMSKDPDFAAAYKYFSENVEYFAEPLIDNEEYGDFDDIFGEDFTEMSQAEPDDILTFDEWAKDITAVWKRDFNG